MARARCSDACDGDLVPPEEKIYPARGRQRRGAGGGRRAARGGAGMAVAAAVAAGAWAAAAGALLTGAAGDGHLGAAGLDGAVDGAVGYLAGLSADNLRVIGALQEAVEAGDLDGAKEAYAKSRAFYERIEVAAGAFPDIDCDIDCRAYAFEFGEATNGVSADDFSTPGAHFKGFHRIEALLYRDGNVEAARGFAGELNATARALDAKLNDRSNFGAAQTLGNAAGLAEEIAAKKMSSEEETYSDLSIVIFANNFHGIRGVIEPFEALVSAETWTPVSAALSAGDASVADLYGDIEDGTTYTPFSEVGFGQRYEIQKAAYDLAGGIAGIAEELGVDLDEEEGEDVCTPSTNATAYPGGGPEVQGDESGGVVYFQGLAEAMAPKVKELQARVAAGDLEGARAAYVLARPEYEQIEVLAGSFEETDCSIDCRPDSFPDGENSPDFVGFHKIEHALFRNNSTADAEAPASGLVELVATLQSELADASLFDGVKSFEGMIGLSGEVVKKKIASEEEAWSGQTLLIFDNNWSGILSQATPFFASAGDASLGKAVESAVADAKACLSEYVSDGDAGEKVYADYGDMPVSGSPGADRECVVEKGYAVMQALVDLAKGLNVFDDCNPFHHGRSLTYRHQAGHPGGPVFDPAAPEGDAGNDGD